MREPIKTTPEELAALLTLCHENIRIADMTDARGIYDQYITKYGANLDPDYTAVAALGTLYRTGYILGQRSERASLNGSAAVRWYVRRSRTPGAVPERPTRSGSLPKGA